MGGGSSNSGSGGDKAPGAVSSTALSGRKLATSKNPRMLTPSEVDLLRQDRQAVLKSLRERAHSHL
jgi:hypothetical protein